MASILDVATTTQTSITSYIVAPIIYVFIGIFIGKIVEQTILYLFSELHVDRPEYRISAYAISTAIYIAAVLLALHSLGFLGIVLWFLLGAVVAVLAVSAVLALKDFFPNFFAYQATKGRYKHGSELKTRFGEASVVSVQLVDTHLRTKDGDELFIPNSTMAALKKEIKTQS